MKLDIIVLLGYIRYLPGHEGGVDLGLGKSGVDMQLTSGHFQVQVGIGLRRTRHDWRSTLWEFQSAEKNCAPSA